MNPHELAITSMHQIGGLTVFKMRRLACCRRSWLMDVISDLASKMKGYESEMGSRRHPDQRFR